MSDATCPRCGGTNLVQDGPMHVLCEQCGNRTSAPSGARRRGGNAGTVIALAVVVAAAGAALAAWLLVSGDEGPVRPQRAEALAPPTEQAAPTEAATPAPARPPAPAEPTAPPVVATASRGQIVDSDPAADRNRSAKRDPAGASTADPFAAQPSEARLSTKLHPGRIFPDAIGNGWLMTRLENDGEGAIDKPRIDVVLYDSSNNETGRFHGYGPDMMFPGETVPIRILLNPLPPYARYEAKVTAREPFLAKRRRAKLTLLSHSLETKKSGISKMRVLTVKLRNDAPGVVKFGKVLTAFLDAEGTIIHVEDRFLKTRELAPGAETTAVFKMFYVGKSEPKDYEVYALGVYNAE